MKPTTSSQSRVKLKWSLKFFDTKIENTQQIRNKLENVLEGG